MSDVTELDAYAWSSIARLWEEVAGVPGNDPDGALEALWRGVGDLFDFDACYVVLASKTPKTRRAHGRGWVKGWLFAEFFFGLGDWQAVFDVSLDDEWHEQVSRDPWLVHLVETAGEHRTVVRNDVLSDEEWQQYIDSTPTGLIGTRDRLTSVFHLDERAEVYLGFLLRDDRRFGERERKIAHVANVGLGSLLWGRLALSYGLLDGHEFLAPREREVLLELLRGTSTADIAEELGLSTGTVHQYVQQLYGKLGVGGRPDLNALWLNPGATRRGGSA